MHPGTVHIYLARLPYHEGSFRDSFCARAIDREGELKSWKALPTAPVQAAGRVGRSHALALYILCSSLRDHMAALGSGCSAVPLI